MIKRIFDFSCALVGIIILSPLFPIIGFFVKKSSKGPIIFKQKRVGLNGESFIIYKFRTMCLTQENESTISVKGDSRVTHEGKMLRRYKIDELPALLNVLKGEMSLVGPRPDVPGYADKLTGEDRKVLKLRPGITGPASLKYANEESILATVKNPKKYNDEVIFPDKVKINLNYYYNNSFLGDLKIIINTIFRTNF